MSRIIIVSTTEQVNGRTRTLIFNKRTGFVQSFRNPAQAAKIAAHFIKREHARKDD